MSVLTQAGVLSTRLPKQVVVLTESICPTASIHLYCDSAGPTANQLWGSTYLSLSLNIFLLPKLSPSSAALLPDFAEKTFSSEKGR